jgi:hypothetical protein
MIPNQWTVPAETTKRLHINNVDNPRWAVDPGFNEAQDSPHHSRPVTNRPIILLALSSPHILDTLRRLGIGAPSVTTDSKEAGLEPASCRASRMAITDAG